MILYAILIATAITIQAATPSPRYEQQFIKFMIPRIATANQEVALCRKHLAHLHFMWRLGEPISLTQQQWLYQTARKYRLKKPDFTHEQDWTALLHRIDVLPESLILAQAILESNWGRSRFAKQGHNYFGQWCTTPGCGLVPRRRPAGKFYEVKKYSNALASIRNYILNINSHRCYKKLRAIRSQLRRTREPITGIELVHGLQHYSQKGKAYIPMILQVIRNNKLTTYDKPETTTLTPGASMEDLWWWATKE